MSVFQAWREARAMRRRARAYVIAIAREPAEDDVRWLARHATAGDEDHARWELRYARRALGLIVAERDALDDRTASAVARELAAAVQLDRHIARDRRRIAEQQLNARIRRYGDVLAHRDGGTPTGARLGRALLAFAGRAADPPPALVADSGALLTRYLAEANAMLREAFGAASLPEHLPPSEAARGISA